jgi:hypothetical protein
MFVSTGGSLAQLEDTYDLPRLFWHSFPEYDSDRLVLDWEVVSCQQLLIEVQRDSSLQVDLSEQHYLHSAPAAASISIAESPAGSEFVARSGIGERSSISSEAS